MARFANTIDELPIYAARAEADKNGDVIDTTYQKKLTAGSGITIDEDNVISATGGGGGDLPPSTSSDEGKVLTVDSSGDPVWDDPQGGGDVPSSDPSDEGKVLTVDANGDPSWQEPQGGTQVQSDWTENDNSDPSYIQHKPTTKPISAGDGISIVEYADNVRITNTVDPQVQADWAENNNSEPDFIKNKPGVKQIVAGANVTINESNSQITISSTGAGGVPVQADWTQADSNQPDYIKNKPTIPTAQVQSNWTETDTTSKSFVLNKPVTKPIVAGNGIVITETATEIIISLA
jgi:hypothetical protein